VKLIEDLGSLFPTKASKHKARYGAYECPVCRGRFITRVAHVKSGNSTKCRSCASTAHGNSGTLNYSRWCSMRSRCYSVDSPAYGRYGARGIRVCDEWLHDFNAYEAHIMALPRAMAGTYSIDRIDTYGDYEPGNLRWASKSTQARNTRVSTGSKSGVNGVFIDGQSKKWRAQITINRVQKYLGVFGSLQQAIAARKAAEIELDFFRPDDAKETL